MSKFCFACQAKLFDNCITRFDRIALRPCPHLHRIKLIHGILINDQGRLWCDKKQLWQHSIIILLELMSRQSYIIRSRIPLRVFFHKELKVITARLKGAFAHSNGSPWIQNEDTENYESNSWNRVSIIDILASQVLNYWSSNKEFSTCSDATFGLLISSIILITWPWVLRRNLQPSSALPWHVASCRREL